MQPTTGERVWEGRLHLGDEPGVYGNAAYAGLITELPVTLHRLSEERGAAETVEFMVEAQDVRIFEGYKGHVVTVMGYFADPERDPEWEARVLATTRLTENVASLRVDGRIPHEVSVRVQVDTDVGPGLYDDFVLVRLSIRSHSHYASLGFRFGD